jgi:hypothetical protein
MLFISQLMSHGSPTWFRCVNLTVKVLGNYMISEIATSENARPAILMSTLDTG